MRQVLDVGPRPGGQINAALVALQWRNKFREESTMKHDTETSAYAHMGMAALLPGMQHMLTLMQAQLDEMRARLPIHSRW